MPVPFVAPPLRRWALGLTSLSLAASACANPQQDIRPGERLSDWLLRHPPVIDQDPLGLSWRAAAEVPTQLARKQRLIDALYADTPTLAALVMQLPATGRVPLALADARWLQANPAEDPVLRPGDSVILPRRSRWVAVVLPNGFLCTVGHQPGASTSAYLEACGQADGRDVAWLMQPDGKVLRQTLRSWNERSQPAPAPGAWLWSPAPHDRLPPDVSEQLASFLALQGPAPGDAHGAIIESHRLEAPRAAKDERDLPVTTNDWGVHGLWQTPSARLGKAGDATFTYFRADPYANLTMQLQPFDWLSGAFRYTDVMYQRYGSFALSGDQSYKDKSVDMKIRLWEESTWLPQVAVGWRDLLGTGIFSGEYVVGSKRSGDFDFSLGMGWGYIGKRGDVSNPLGALSDRFNARPTSSNATGGKFNVKAYFRGAAALFAGVQYHTPWDGFIVKAEYEGNDYKNEPFRKNLKAKSPYNIGVVWQYKPWLDVSLAWERGDTLGFGLSAHADLDGMKTPKYLDPPRVPVSAQRPPMAGTPSDTVHDIAQQTGLQITRIEREQNTWTAVATNPVIGYAAPVVDRALSVLHRDAPPEADRLSLRLEKRGASMVQVDVDRDRWALGKTQRLPDSLQAPEPTFTAPTSADATTQTVHEATRKVFDWNVGFGYGQNIGGPDAFVLYQLAASLNAEWRPREDTWLTGTFGMRIIDNYEKFRYTAPSNMTRVRTYLREYTTTSRNTIPNLQLTHMGQVGQNHFYLAYAGLLESMYAGAGLEYLYRPVGSRLAVGIDINRVQQRGFSQKFEMRDYRTKTGHLSVYWDTGFSDMLVSASVGQYLAGDRGMTFEASKVFSNGVTIGAYATMTNVSAAQFGEGSFDKGVYLTVPFDVMLPRSGPSSAQIVYAPLIRDGGAKLGRRYNLYDLTSLRDSRAMTIGR